MRIVRSVEPLLLSPVGLPVLALPEHAAVLGVGEGPEQSGAVLGGDDQKVNSMPF